MVADDDLWKLHNYKAKIYNVEEEIWGKHGFAFCPHTRYNTRHARRRGAMPICWCLSSGWLDVGPAMGAHEQRVHFIKWFIQDMIINGGTLLSRQESIDARSRHSRSPGLADRERRRSKTNEEQSRHDRVRVFVCLYLWESEGERMYDEWWRERETEGRRGSLCILTNSSIHVCLLSPFLPLRTLSVYAALRPTPRFQLH